MTSTTSSPVLRGELCDLRPRQLANRDHALVELLLRDGRFEVAADVGGLGRNQSLPEQAHRRFHDVVVGDRNLCDAHHLRPLKLVPFSFGCDSLTLRIWPFTSLPFKAAMAAFASASFLNSTKPNPRDSPLTRSFTRFAASALPNGATS